MALSSPSGATASVARSTQLEHAYSDAADAAAWVMGVQNHLSAARAPWAVRYWANFAAFCLHRVSAMIASERAMVQAQERQERIAASAAPVPQPSTPVQRAQDAQRAWNAVHGVDGGGLWS